MFLLILESLGSTELLFILVMALVFFGPRKLPQLSRKLGKSVAEFRRASEDFKSTWEREVALENSIKSSASSTTGFDNGENFTDDANQPRVTSVPAENQIARSRQGTLDSGDADTSREPSEVPVEPPAKRDWL